MADKQAKPKSRRVSKRDYSDRINDRLGLEVVLGHKLDFSKMALGDLLDLNGLIRDPALLKKVFMAIGSDFMDGELLELAQGFLGGEKGELVEKFLNSDTPGKDMVKEAIRGTGEDIVDTAIDQGKKKIRERFPIVGQLLQSRDEFRKVRKKPDEK